MSPRRGARTLSADQLHMQSFACHKMTTQDEKVNEQENRVSNHGHMGHFDDEIREQANVEEVRPKFGVRIYTQEARAQTNGDANVTQPLMTMEKDVSENQVEMKRKNAQSRLASEVEQVVQQGVEQEDCEDECYRPSCMSHWLRATGRRMEDRFEAFKEYKGRASHSALGLEMPTPMEKDDDGSEWSHMSDYDEIGFAPGECCGEVEPEIMESAGDVAFGMQRCQEPNRVQGHVSGTQKEEDHVDNVREIQTLKDEAHENDHEGRFQAAMRNKQVMQNTTIDCNYHPPTSYNGHDDYNPDYRNHVDTCHVSESHDVTIHEESKDGSSEVMTVQEKVGWRCRR